MGQSAPSLLLLLLTVSQVRGRPYAAEKYAAEKSPCSPVEVELSAKVRATKFAPGYLLAVDGSSSSTLSQKLDERGIAGFPESSVCTATGYPVGERNRAEGEALLSLYGLSRVGSGGNAAAGSNNVLCIQEAGEPLAFVFTELGMRSLCLHKTFVLEVMCPRGGGDTVGGVEFRKHCYTLSLPARGRSEFLEERLFRRHTLSVQPKEGDGPEVQRNGVSTFVVGVAVGVVGLVVLVLVLAMCGSSGSDKYDTVQPKATATSKRVSGSEVAEPAPQDLPDDAPDVKVLKTNGTPSVSPPVGSSDAKGEASSRLSTPSMKDVSERGRTLSARSFDPLPDVPKLELAEGSNNKGEEGNGGGDNDDDDDDDDNPYAEVPRDGNDGMADSGSDGEEKPDAVATPIPPYGKVSRHSKVSGDATKDAEEVDDTDSYAEVRDVMKRGLPLFGERERSHTQPPNPKDLAAPRDKRSQTESSATLMPLPDIPPAGAAAAAAAAALLAEEAVMYDSIQESQLGKPSQPKKKERLYESMDEVAEDDKDLYESVPDSLTMVESPRTPTSTSLSTPTLAIPKQLSDVPPMPPSSPIPNRNEHMQQQPSKKMLEKTLSASDEGKRRFSFFNRKKTASVSSTKPKKGDHPKGDHPKGEQQPESPTALVASGSPKHKSPPPLPNIPVPPPPDEDDEEEDTYDRVTPGVLSGQDAFQLGAAADDPKVKAMSLPMSYRTGGRPNVPLPRVPEDSGSGTVQHQRVMEGGGGLSDYDMVQRIPDRIPDEPNYDTVEMGRTLVPPSATFDPPYDKIDKKELQELREKEMESRERLRSSSPEDSVVRGEESVGSDQPGLHPDHDEEGYAVVPEEIRMRKRAMSASLAMKQQKKQLSPESTAAGYRTVRYQEDEQPYNTIAEVRPHSMTVSSPSRGGSEAQYATVDMSAKRDKKKQELEEALRMQEELRTSDSTEPPRASPVPPPLPPALDPEDMEEFKQPPIPHQSDGMHELLQSGGGPEEPRAESGDPPYARVKGEPAAQRKSSSDPPYARVNELDVPQQPDAGGDPEAQQKDGSDPPYARVNELDVPRPDSGDPPYARVKSKTTYAEVNRPYAEVDVDWVQNQAVIRSSGQSATAQDEAPDGAVPRPGADKEDKPYDTIQDLKADMESATHQLELEMPKLETADDGAANIYDSLLPDSPASGQDEEQVSSPSDTKRDTPRSMV